MAKRTAHITRANFNPAEVLRHLERKGAIGGDEAKRLLAEACEAYIDLLRKAHEACEHMRNAKTAMERVLPCSE